MNLKELISHKIYKKPLSEIDSDGTYTINTINAHSYCLAKKNQNFADVLQSSDVLLPDGSSIVLATRILAQETIKKIAGADIHHYLLEQAHLKRQKVFYMGASDETLKLIKNNVLKNYPNIKVCGFSPPYAAEFSKDQNSLMIAAVNEFKPDILFVGMTAPKQEKWVFNNKNQLNAKIICSIGAVFDFYAGNINRAPKWMIKIGMEWLFRLIKEPKRMWKRYLINNTLFLVYVLQEKYL